MDKPNVLIMTDKFAEVSREPIQILVNAGIEVHEHSYNTVGSISDGKFCELIQGMDVLVVTGSFPVSRRVIQSADRLMKTCFTKPYRWAGSAVPAWMSMPRSRPS